MNKNTKTNISGSISVRKKHAINTRVITRAAAATVLIMGATMLSLPMPLGGYIHLGDAVIFVACIFLSWWAVPAAAIGSCLADIFLGYSVFAPGTLVIKGTMAIICILIAGKSQKQSKWLLSFVVASIFMQLSYILYQYSMAFLGFDQDSLELFYSGWYLVLINFLIGCIQSVASIPLACITLGGLRKSGFLEKSKADNKKLAEDNGEADNPR